MPSKLSGCEGKLSGSITYNGDTADQGSFDLTQVMMLMTTTMMTLMMMMMMMI
jgi:hypothetical protein